MNKKFYDELNSWKNSKNGVPLIVVGQDKLGKHILLINSVKKTITIIIT